MLLLEFLLIINICELFRCDFFTGSAGTYYLSCETVRWFAGNRIQMEEKSREIKDIRSEIYEINADADLMEAASRFYLFDLCDQLFACIHQT